MPRSRVDNARTFRARGSVPLWGLSLWIATAVFASCGGGDESPPPQDVDPCASVYAGLCGKPCTDDSMCDMGLYCGSDDTCTADCAPFARTCPIPKVCSNRGRCVVNLDAGTGGSGGTFIDAMPEGGGSGGNKDVCADIDVTFEKQIPTVMLLIDQSGSMRRPFEGTRRWDAAYDALMDPTGGVVQRLDIDVRFGLTLYTSHGGDPPCPELTKVPIAIQNCAAIDAVYSQAQPESDTPTGESLEAIIPDVLAVSEAGPRIIVLATDGEPDTCARPHVQTGQPEAVAAAENAFSQGIRTFIISVGDQVGLSHLQDMANAGVGNPIGGPDNAPYYVANNQDELYDAFDAIITGVRSCVFTLNGAVEPGMEDEGTVILDGEELGYEDSDGYQVNGESEIELLGDACETIKDGDHELSVTFPCDAVVINPPR